MRNASTVGAATAAPPVLIKALFLTTTVLLNVAPPETARLVTEAAPLGIIDQFVEEMAGVVIVVPAWI